MPKFPTFPTLFDECKTISISKLKEWGYLEPNQYKQGTITWSRNGNKTASISIAVDTYPETPCIELKYKVGETLIVYRVGLLSKPSNLGKGIVWFFLCPQTEKVCRKLHLIGNYFYHRSAFKGCFYEKQTYSRYMRSLDKVFGIEFGRERAYELVFGKHFKTHYAGKPTKKFAMLEKRYGKLDLSA